MSGGNGGARVLVVDDAPDTVEVIVRNLEGAGYWVLSAPDVAGALAVLEDVPVDLVVTDLRMPRASGLDLVRHVRENLPDTAVVLITGYASIDGAVAAVKGGAEDYLAKPFTDEELLATVKRTLDALAERRSRRSALGAPAPAGYDLVGESEALRTVRDAIARAAAADATVFITGESGTGKELVARAIHYAGPRAAAPFTPVNCGGIPPGLIESALFGHVKGAFTGAGETRAGFFLTSDGGTLFLDEIGNTGLDTQARLLRAIENKEVCLVGSGKPQRVDVRIVAATNQDPARLVERGLFREDLYYRLNVIGIRLPALRERPEDVPLLAGHFARMYARGLDREAPGFADGAIRALCAYDWPGNIRELQNLVHRLVLMKDAGPVEVPDLPAAMRFSATRGPGPFRTLAEVETEYVRKVVAAVGGNKTRAAEILGIDRKTLRIKLEERR